MNLVHFADHGSQGYYRPFAIRPPVLISLLVFTLTLIALTEYACRNIPNHAGIGTLGKVVNETIKGDLTANIQRDSAHNVERSESFIPILSNPFSFNTLFSVITSSSSSSSSVTTTATGGNLSLGGGSTSLPGHGVVSTTIVASGGWLSPGDGATTTDPASIATAQASTINSPASNPASQPTSPPALGGVDNSQSDPNTPGSAAPSSILMNPVQQPTGVVTPEGGPAGTVSPAAAAATEAVNSVATLPESFANPVPDTNTGPSPVEFVSNGQTLVETPISVPVTSDGSPIPVVVTSDGQVFTQTPIANPSPVVLTSDGKTFTQNPNDVPAPLVVVSNGQTFTQTPNGSPTPITFVSNGQTITETPSPNAAMATPTPVVFVSNGHTFTSTPSPVVFVSDGKTFISIPTPVVLVSDGKTFTSMPTPVVFVSNGQTFTSLPALNTQLRTPSLTPIIYVSKGHTFTSTSSSTPSATEPAIKPVATVVNSTGTFLLWSNGESTIYPQITVSQYTLVSFIPLLLAVIYTIPFRFLDRTIREMEAFYQLHSPGGALAEFSLCLDYTTSNALITPFKAGLRGHAFMLWSSLISLAVIALAPLSSEALFVSLSGVQGLYGADITEHSQDYASWGVYPDLARLIEGLLSFVAVLIVVMLWAGRKRESGVYGEPLSIVGLATLFHSSPLLRGFRHIDSMVMNKELKGILEGQRYKLGEFVSANYRAAYGLLSADSEAGFIVDAHKSRKDLYRLVEGAESSEQVGVFLAAGEKSKQKSMSWDEVKEKLLCLGILIVVTGMLTLICYYHWSEGDIHHGFEHFMDSGGFGVRFMMTALGVALKMFWSKLDQDIRRTTPFTRLASSSTDAIDSILVPSYTSPFSAIIPSLRQKHFLVAHIALLSILSEFLPICLANITFSAATTLTAYETCNDISLIILILMLLSIIYLVLQPLFSRSRNAVKLPRSPDTVASILMYLAASSAGKAMGERGREQEGLLESLKGLERMSTEERNEIVIGWGRRYALGGDREGHLRIDEARNLKL